MRANSSSDIVRAARDYLGLTQIEFGKKIGVSRHTVWRYETGGTLPQRSRIVIAQLLPKRKKRLRRQLLEERL